MDLNFAVMIESAKNEDQLIELVLGRLDGATRTGGYIQYKNNVLVFRTNTRGDELDMHRNAADAWMYYAHELSAFSVSPSTLEVQRSIAGELMSAFRQDGALVELVAEFELQA